MEGIMKKMAVTPLVVLLVLTTLSTRAAQSDNPPKLSSIRVEKTSKKAISISGTVGTEGKTLVSEKDNRIWNVTNPDSLKPSEGRRVTVKGQVIPSTSEITVTVVRLKYERLTAKLDDAAFRR
jgi:hypothetical protein